MVGHFTSAPASQHMHPSQATGWYSALSLTAHHLLSDRLSHVPYPALFPPFRFQPLSCGKPTFVPVISTGAINGLT